MKIPGIYKIQSKIKQESFYIGSAVNINNKWTHHLCDLRKGKHGNSKLQRHYNKYGESDLQFSILLGCDKEDLIKTEQYFIDSYNPPLNICKIARSRLGCRMSDENKKRLKEIHKIYHHGQSEETRKKISRSLLETFKNDPTKKKKKKINSSVIKPNAIKSNVVKIDKRKTHTKEHDRKISDARKGHLVSSETRRKISEKLIGVKLSLEHRQHISNGLKLRNLIVSN